MLQNDIHNSVFLPAIPAQRPKALPPCWDRNIKLLPGISSISYTKVPTWTPKQVADFLLNVVPSITSTQRRLFIDQVSNLELGRCHVPVTMFAINCSKQFLWCILLSMNGI